MHRNQGLLSILRKYFDFLKQRWYTNKMFIQELGLEEYM